MEVYDIGMEIVLIHLNTKIPKYLERNLTRIRDSFPLHEIVLVSNRTQPKIEGIELKVYDESTESRELNSLLSHPKDFRDNFWHASIARFTYLLSYQIEVDKPVLHVESDVILAPDFPMNLINQGSKIAYPVLSKQRGVASIFFSPDQKSLKKLVEFIVSSASLNAELTDMLVLREYFDKFPLEIEVLPAGPASEIVYEPEIKLDIYSNLEEGITKFKGVFDGCDIGMYLFGTDPRNRLGITLIRDEIATTYTRMSKMRFRYNKTRNFLDVESQGEWIPIYNLHMTSKDLKLFSTNRPEKSLARYLKYEKFTKLFVPRVFTRMALAKIVRVIRRVYN